MYKWWTFMVWRTGRQNVGGFGVKLGPLTVCWQKWDPYYRGWYISWLNKTVVDQMLTQMKKDTSLERTN